MIRQSELGKTKTAQLRELSALIRSGEISLAGYARSKIYGMLNCSSGKRMKPANRVFFKNENEAIREGYRPCGNCMREAYKKWKG